MVRCTSEPRLAPSITNPASARTSRSLPSSDGWQLKKGSWKGPPGAASGEAEDEDEADACAEEGVDPDPQLAEARVVDPRQHEHPDDPEPGIDRLSLEEVG